MSKETPEQEAEALYPNEPDMADYLSPNYSINEVRQYQRSAHITCGRQYMGEIEKLRAENSKMRKALEAEGYCTMCHGKKKQHALLVCDTCYDSFDGDRRSFWDDDFVH